MPELFPMDQFVSTSTGEVNLHQQKEPLAQDAGQPPANISEEPERDCLTVQAT